MMERVHCYTVRRTVCQWEEVGVTDEGDSKWEGYEVGQTVKMEVIDGVILTQ